MFGIAVAAIVMAQFDDSGSALANYGVALGGALGLVTWVVIELVIGIALAVFETQQRQLSSTRGLPHATVIRK